MANSVLKKWKRGVRRSALVLLKSTVRLRRLSPLSRQERPGVTAVAVEYRSLDALKVLVTMFRRHTEPEVRLLIILNESTPETRDYLRNEGVQFVSLPVNIGHADAMDLGWLAARTEFVIALDIDAFPISDGWVEMVLDPLRSGYLVAGGRLTSHESYRKRPYVQPCYLAMRRSTFLRKRLSFRPTSEFDTGEAITYKVGPEAAFFIEQTEVRGPGPVGSVFGDAVYHNFYGTRFTRDERDVLDDIVHRSDADLAWSEAVERWV